MRASAWHPAPARAGRRAQREDALDVAAAGDVVQQPEGGAHAAVADGYDDAAHRDRAALVLRHRLPAHRAC